MQRMDIPSASLGINAFRVSFVLLVCLMGFFLTTESRGLPKDASLIPFLMAFYALCPHLWRERGFFLREFFHKIQWFFALLLVLVLSSLLTARGSDYFDVGQFLMGLVRMVLAYCACRVALILMQGHPQLVTRLISLNIWVVAGSVLASKAAHLYFNTSVFSVTKDGRFAGILAEPSYLVYYLILCLFMMSKINKFRIPLSLVFLSLAAALHSKALSSLGLMFAVAVFLCVGRVALPRSRPEFARCLLVMIAFIGLEYSSRAVQEPILAYEKERIEGIAQGTDASFGDRMLKPWKQISRMDMLQNIFGLGLNQHDVYSRKNGDDFLYRGTTGIHISLMKIYLDIGLLGVFLILFLIDWRDPRNLVFIPLNLISGTLFTFSFFMSMALVMDKAKLKRSVQRSSW